MRQNALITGASRGFGLAVARSLGEAGWSLVVDARGADALSAAAANLGTIATIDAIAGDVTDPTHRERLLTAIQARGRLDLLVNNASELGPSPQPRVADYDIAELRQVFEVNVLGPLGLIQTTLPLLRTSRGAIVNVTSDAAVEQYEGWAGYGSSKAALDQISNVLAAEEPDIRVYWFDPGDMRTRMHQEAFPGEDISDRPLPESRVPALLRLLEERPPSGRYTAGQLLVGTSP